MSIIEVVINENRNKPFELSDKQLELLKEITGNEDIPSDIDYYHNRSDPYLIYVVKQIKSDIIVKEIYMPEGHTYNIIRKYEDVDYLEFDYIGITKYDFSEKIEIVKKY